MGQDTDGLTKGFSAGIDGLIKLDKPDYFSGRNELFWQTDQGRDGTRLVPILTVEPARVPQRRARLLSARRSWDG